MGTGLAAMRFAEERNDHPERREILTTLIFMTRGYRYKNLHRVYNKEMWAKTEGGEEQATRLLRICVERILREAEVPSMGATGVGSQAMCYWKIGANHLGIIMIVGKEFEMRRMWKFLEYAKNEFEKRTTPEQWEIMRKKKESWGYWSPKLEEIKERVIQEGNQEGGQDENETVIRIRHIKNPFERP